MPTRPRRILDRIREWTLILLCVLAIAGLALVAAMAEVAWFAVKSHAAARLLARP